MKELKEMSKKFPNDREFGGNVRKIIRSTDEFGEIEKSNPNDEDLGKFLRKFLVD